MSRSKIADLSETLLHTHDRTVRFPCKGSRARGRSYRLEANMRRFVVVVDILYISGVAQTQYHAV